MVVYPSYPAGPTKSRVLIASYCWTQDAERLGALINWDGTAKPELIEKVMNDLATIHNVDVDDLWALYTPGDYFARDWLHNPETMGKTFATSSPLSSSECLHNRRLRSIRPSTIYR